MVTNQSHFSQNPNVIGAKCQLGCDFFNFLYFDSHIATGKNMVEIFDQDFLQ